MNFKPFATIALVITAISFSAPAFSETPVIKPNPNIDLSTKYVNPSRKLNTTNKPAPTSQCKVCTQWGKGQPGQLFGPCIRYEYQPCFYPVLH